MATPKEPHIAVMMQGHRMKGGDANGIVWLQKVQKLINVLARLEREKDNLQAKKTDYNLFDLQKKEQFIVRLRPVPKKSGYDPLPSFEWAVAQLENIATNQLVAPEVDGRTAALIAEMAEPDPEAYEKFWMNGYADPVYFNEDFTAKARALASERIIAQKPFSWFEGSAKGSLTGSLRYVDGISGQQTFAIVPSVGANRIVCNYEEKLEALLRDNLFKRVRIYGTLKYGSDSPHPHSVDVEKIEPMNGQERRSSQDLRGLFSDLEMPSGKIAGLLHG